MDIHEYQAKKILSDFGVNIPRGGIAYSPENAEFKAREIGGSKWVVKAQVHSGARGKAGGIILCKSELEVAQATDKLLGKKLITNQTGPSGKIINRVYIEEATEIKKELYLGPYVGEPTDHTIIPFGKGICGQVAESNSNFVVPDVNAQDNYIACSLDVKSELVVPLFLEGKNIGQIDIDSNKLNPFSKEDELLLEACCDLISKTYGNSLLSL